MPTKLAAEVKKTKNGKIRIEISRDEFERFCNTFGFFRKDFLKLLHESEKDHQVGRVTRRSSLLGLTNRVLKKSKNSHCERFSAKQSL
jgi:hypothetical protein